MALDTLVVYEVLPESLQVDNFEFSIPPPPPLPLPLSIMPLLLFSSYLADFMGGVMADTVAGIGVARFDMNFDMSHPLTY